MGNDPQIRRRKYPLGEAVDLEILSQDPYPTFARLRVEEPVSWVPALGMWLLTRRKDVLDVLKDTETFTTDAESSTIRTTFGPQMLSTEGAQQRRHRRRANAMNRQAYIDAHLVDPIRNEAERLLAELGKRGSFELRRQFAAPLALFSVATLLGLSARDFPFLRTTYDRFAAALANFTGDREVRAAGLTAADSFRKYLKPRLRASGGMPQGTLLAELSAPTGPSGAAGEDLSEEEICSNAMLILFGGLETTEAMIANAAWALGTHDDARATVGEDTGRIRQALHESLRWGRRGAIVHPSRDARRAIARRRYLRRRNRAMHVGCGQPQSGTFRCTRHVRNRTGQLRGPSGVRLREAHLFGRVTCANRSADRARIAVRHVGRLADRQKAIAGAGGIRVSQAAGSVGRAVASDAGYLAGSCSANFTARRTQRLRSASVSCPSWPT